MKKLLLLSFICLAFMFASQMQIQAQPIHNENDTLALIIWIEGSNGQTTDSVFIYVKPESTEGYDPEFEVNLYGIPPQGDIDLRLVQRIDTNYIVDSIFHPIINPSDYGPYWLMCSGTLDDGWYFDYWCRPYNKNVDLKINYIPVGLNKLVFYLHSTNNTSFTVFAKMLYYKDNKWDHIYNCYFHEHLTINFYDTINGELKTVSPPKAFRIDNPVCSLTVPEHYNLTNTFMMLHFGGMSKVKDDIIYKNELFPNPTDKYVVLEDALLSTYNLLDNNGAILKTFNIENVPFQLDISNLPTGNYFIVDEARSIFYKFIKK